MDADGTWVHLSTLNNEQLSRQQQQTFKPASTGSELLVANAVHNLKSVELDVSSRSSHSKPRPQEDSADHEVYSAE